MKIFTNFTIDLYNMKSRMAWLAIVLTTLCGVNCFPQASSYFFSQSNETFTVPTSGFTGTNGLSTTTPALFGVNWNDADLPVTLPFQITFNSVATTSLFVNTDGWVHFDFHYIYPFLNFNMVSR